MDSTEIRVRIEDYARNFSMEHAWRRIDAEVFPVRSKERFVGALAGITPALRTFQVWMILDESDLTDQGIKISTENALRTLDTFMDFRCQCRPKVTGLIGDHCEYHKKLFGY